MLDYIDSWLSKITMYRLVLYCLTLMIAVAIILSLVGLVPYAAFDIFYTWAFLVLFCWVSNKLLSLIFRVPTNIESDYITAFILTLILTPNRGLDHLWVLALAALASQASKYILAFRGKHIFNPAALGVVATAFILNQGASWWVGTAWMLPVVAVCGLLIIRKIQRFDLTLSFIIVYFVYLVSQNPSDTWFLFTTLLLNSPIIFFSTVMLTEPQTSPPTRLKRIIYGSLIAIFFSVNLGQPNLQTLEVALLAGNIVSFVLSPKGRFALTLKRREQINPQTFDYIFESNHKIDFEAGQYLEWTLAHPKPDTRGFRRYFTVASSPTENEIRLGSKFYENPSTFKKALATLEPGAKIWVGQLSGEFTLPKNKDEKLVFIAGGIGITPFRSMIKFLFDRNEKRDIVLFYSNKEQETPAYKELLDQAVVKLGLKVTYVPGKLESETVKIQVPDFKERKFYISGPHPMVVAFEQTLKQMGVRRSKIKIDFFPGYA